MASGAALLLCVLASTTAAAGKTLLPSRTAVDYVPGEVVVGYAPHPKAALATDATPTAPDADTDPTIIHVRSHTSIWTTIARLKRRPGVAYAVPNYIAHAAGAWFPDDPGRTKHAKGWEKIQWNFLGDAGVNAPEAWAHLFGAHHPGGRGVVVAVLDTGVAYRNWQLPVHPFTRFKKSPDFGGTRFIDPCDLIAGRIRRGRCTNPDPLDRDGHGTFVTGTIAETTNNGVSLTGLAWGATIMPIRVLDANGNGDAATIARGIRYAVNHRAQIINLSLEFNLAVDATDIPDIISAIQYAHRHGAIVVGASGNDSSDQVAYPARAPGAISVGATTKDRCLAWYSNGGSGLDLVAPGGDQDSAVVSDASCHPGRPLPDIFQLTFVDAFSPRRFGLPDGWYGTSMAAAHVSAAAALVIASGVIGRHPGPDQVLARLEQTARPLGGSQPNDNYGFGLLDAGAATARTPH